MKVERPARVALPLRRFAAIVLGASLSGALPSSARADDAPAPAAPAPAAPVPTQPSPPPAAPQAVMPGATMVHSPALAAGGYVLGAFGLASIIGGAAAAVAGSHSGCDVCGFGYAVSGAVIVHGVGCLAGAIPMVVIGHRRIPVPTLMPLMVKPRGTWAERAAPVGLALAGAF